MARIALIKLFTGLNLAPAQLSGELQRAGHSSRIIYFKDHHIVDYDKYTEYEVTDYPGVFIAADGTKKVWNCYKPISEKEWRLLIEDLQAYQPDAIGLSVISGIIREAGLVTAKLKQHFDVPVIWGGPGPTLEPERCIQLTEMLCINEGEEVIVDLANRLDAKADISDIPGIWLKRPDGSVVKNPERPLMKLDDIAIPDWNLENYVHINAFKGKRTDIYPNNLGKEYPIMTQRGCPFSCSFCIESRYQDMFGKKNSLRRRSIDLVLEELRWAKEHLDIKSILFYDDVFTVNPRWLKDFLPRYKQEIGLPFWCYTYPTTHTPELLQQLKDAGMISITMGVQSGSSRILSEYFNRPTERARVLEAAQEIVDLGPDVKGFFDLITKVPFETEQDLRDTFNFLVELPVEFKTMGFGEMTNFPTYDFTRQTDEQADLIASQGAALTQEDYDYYHKLYLLTRTDMPRDQVRGIGEDPRYRTDPQLLDQLINNDTYMSFTGISF
jgi:anaerobic magnesium-protoporphyrin IX monomethyl ester cyclase